MTGIGGHRGHSKFLGRTRIEKQGKSRPPRILGRPFSADNPPVKQAPGGWATSCPGRGGGSAAPPGSRDTGVRSRSPVQHPETFRDAGEGQGVAPRARQECADPRRRNRGGGPSYPRVLCVWSRAFVGKNVPSHFGGPLARNSVTAAQGIDILTVPLCRVGGHAWWPVGQVALMIWRNCRKTAESNARQPGHWLIFGACSNSGQEWKALVGRARLGGCGRKWCVRAAQGNLSRCPRVYLAFVAR